MAQLGTTVILQVRTATGPDVYTTIGGQTGLAISFERDAIDSSSKDIVDAEFLAGRRQSTISCPSLFVPNEAARAALKAAYNSTSGSARIRVPAIGAEAGRQADCIITSLSEDHPDNDVSTVAVELQVTGVWTGIS
jgi:predicted secreted protein